MARLPTPGQDSGTWGTVLNEYLTTSLTPDGILKADVVATSQLQDTSITSQKLAPNAVTATKIADGSITTNKLAPGMASNLTTNGAYPLSAYGFFSASTPLESCAGTSTFGSLFFARVFVPANHPINVIGTVVSGAGTVGAGGNNCFALYDDTGAMVATTPANNAQWSTAGWSIGTLTTPIPAQQADRFVYISAFVIGYSAVPSVVYNVVGNQALLYTGNGMPTHRRAFYANGVPTLPASINPTTYGSESNYLPLYTIG
jgi:hypothetical protein